MKRLSYIALATVLAFPAAAEIQINGFANFIGGMTTNDEDSVYEYDGDLGFTPNSLVAIQVRSQISPELSATAQLLGRGSEDYDAKFEWAYFTYNLSEQSSLSGGRLRLPLFKYSASLDVGYSYHWIAPPSSVYDVPFNNVDGIRFDHQSNVGDWDYNIQLVGGSNTSDVNIAGQSAELEIKNILAISASASRDGFSARALRAVGKVSISAQALDPLLDGLNQFSPILPNTALLAEQIDTTDESGTFSEIALDYDAFDWFVGAEFTRIELDDGLISENQDAWYVTAGMRLGKFTPHITYEVYEADENKQGLALANGLPFVINTGNPALDAAWAGSGLKQGATGLLLGQRDDTEAVNLGLRYDLMFGLALKADITWYESNLNAAQDATLVRFGANYTF
ncbi:topoisomerase IV [Aliiglaciecola sp. CAU 1673]|uniref:topoisomerase IV n=1 Tax=Aliiglaciecola sp. CAU 1673 TaxID=3032595 RepID=UPI0023DBDC3C|nr:topoisomerase IV [Aliiglaciecola sp. CAU 1673]MDF2179154.1 topoisomerase IV [Aliiglaciecola sp. CAU 1673]